MCVEIVIIKKALPHISVYNLHLSIAFVLLSNISFSFLVLLLLNIVIIYDICNTNGVHALISFFTMYVNVQNVGLQAYIHVHECEYVLLDLHDFVFVEENA